MNWVGDLIQRSLSPDDMVLNLGCGIMQATLDTCKSYPPTRIQCKSILGVDIYHKYLDFLKDKGVMVLRADISWILPFRSNSFDVVLLLDVVEHLNFEFVFELLQEAERVARKRVIVLTPRNFEQNVEATKDVYPYCNLGENPYQHHKCLVSAENLRQHGFNVYFPHQRSKQYRYVYAVKVVV